MFVTNAIEDAGCWCGLTGRGPGGRYAEVRALLNGLRQRLHIFNGQWLRLSTEPGWARSALPAPSAAPPSAPSPPPDTHKESAGGEAAPSGVAERGAKVLKHSLAAAARRVECTPGVRPPHCSHCRVLRLIWLALM